MRQTIATSSSYQLLLKNKGYELEQEDITAIYEALVFARNELDMDNMTEINILSDVIEALEEAS